MLVFNYLCGYSAQMWLLFDGLMAIVSYIPIMADSNIKYCLHCYDSEEQVKITACSALARRFHDETVQDSAKRLYLSLYDAV